MTTWPLKAEVLVAKGLSFTRRWPMPNVGRTILGRRRPRSGLDVFCVVLLRFDPPKSIKSNRSNNDSKK